MKDVIVDVLESFAINLISINVQYLNTLIESREREKLQEYIHIGKSNKQQKYSRESIFPSINFDKHARESGKDEENDCWKVFAVKLLFFTFLLTNQEPFTTTRREKSIEERK